MGGSPGWGLARRLMERCRTSSEAAYVLGWALGPLAMLEIVRTKLIHYYLPALPACALAGGWLIAGMIARGISIDEAAGRVGRMARRSMIALGLAGSAAVAGLTWVLPSELFWPTLAIAASSATGAAVGGASLGRGRADRAAFAMIVCGMIGLSTLFLGFLPRAANHMISHRVGEALARHEARSMSENPESPLFPAMASFRPPGVVFALGHPLPEILNMAHLRAALAERGRLLVALTDAEIERFEAEGDFELEFLERLTGFDVVKFRSETLTITVVTARGGVGGESRGD